MLALWNTFIFAGAVGALLRMFEGRFASTIASMRDVIELPECAFVGPVALERLYQDLEVADFSRDVLERHERMLQVLRVPTCGWTDLGTPKRVAETVRSLSHARSMGAKKPAASRAPYLDLAAQQKLMLLPAAAS